MKSLFLIFVIMNVISASGWADTESMRHMPLAQEKQVKTVTASEDFSKSIGFGPETSAVRMMNSMMVEGSGMEGMEMAPVKPNPSPFEIRGSITPNPPKVGSNQVDFAPIDPSSKKPVPGLKLQAQVFMTSMDMGTEEPKIQEVSPGHYRVNVEFAMKGPWAVRIRAQNWEHVLNFNLGE